ncbi:bile acid-CoA:amino acid N-acyltransferase isoform X2 [Sorex fumeus]|uniref:bile acid-CoA:amino acid N-acyltransferase isoform X2 n=1 Tax=Sorex fumeus TaxID=62283 RepID=UPI0024ADF9D4|nr:bile acid-CoA:amino acid N-acyltransferase isoform X2 [Sorex fumeus]
MRAGSTTGYLRQLSMFQLRATPESALVDVPVHIRATGLPPSEVVTLVASLKDDKGLPFQSRAFYRADEYGELDLTKAPALGGDYVGVHPMGLFWSLKPEKVFRRLIKKDVMNTPFEVTLELYESVLTHTAEGVEPKAKTTVKRWYSVPEVQRMPMREGRLRGAFFLPPGEGPFPGVIDLFGGIGGLIEFRASLLASHGFAVLALAYFNFEDLPSDLLEVDLEYFEEAANFLLAHPKIQGPGVGVVGVSKGAEIALSMACFLKQIVATVCINGPTTANEPSPHRYRDLTIPGAIPSPERLQFDSFGNLIFRQYKWEGLDEYNQKSIIPVEKAHGQILFIVGEDDQCVNSKDCAEQSLRQLRSHGKSNGRILAYPGAGHLIEPPYSPLCYASWSPGFPSPLLWGGQPEAHAAAQEHAWAEIQKFLRQNLTGSKSKL